MNSTHLNL